MSPEKSIYGYALFYIPHVEDEEEVYKLLSLKDNLIDLEIEKERMWRVWQYIHTVPDNFVIVELTHKQYVQCEFIENYDLDLVDGYTDVEIHFRSNVVLNTIIKDFLKKQFEELFLEIK